MTRSIAGFFSALVRHQAFFVLVLLGTFIGVGLQFSGTQPLASAAETCTNAICVPAGDAAQWRAGNLILNTGNAYANGLLVPYGNVGIGTTDPQAKLDVVGTSLFQGKVYIGAATASEIAATQEALTVEGGITSDKIAADQSLCLKGKCISDWSEIGTAGKNPSPDTWQSCGNTFGTTNRSCTEAEKTNIIETRCYGGTITDCEMTSSGLGGVCRYKATGCGSAPAPVYKYSAPVRTKVNGYISAQPVVMGYSFGSSVLPLSPVPTGTQCSRGSDRTYYVNPSQYDSCDGAASQANCGYYCCYAVDEIWVQRCEKQ